MFEMMQIYVLQLVNRFRRNEDGAALAEYVDRPGWLYRLACWLLKRHDDHSATLLEDALDDLPEVNE